MYGGDQGCIQGSRGKPEGKRHLEYPGVDGRMILRWVFRKWVLKAWTGSMWSYCIRHTGRKTDTTNLTLWRPKSKFQVDSHCVGHKNNLLLHFEGQSVNCSSKNNNLFSVNHT